MNQAAECIPAELAVWPGTFAALPVTPRLYPVANRRDDNEPSYAGVVPETEHEALFRMLVAEDNLGPDRAAALLGERLPPDLARHVDRADPPELLESVFYEDCRGQRRRSGPLFRIWQKPDVGESRVVTDPGYFLTLLETRSHMDWRTAHDVALARRQILRRERAFDVAPEGGRRAPLPEVCPMVFHHGPLPWVAPRSLEESGLHLATEWDFDDDGRWASEFVLHDLSAVADPRDMSAHRGVAACLLALQMFGESSASGFESEFSAAPPTGWRG